MILNVLLFASARPRSGEDSITLDVPEGATVRELRAALGEALPAIARVARISRFAVNRRFAEDGVVISELDEIAIIPPVSGG